MIISKTRNTKVNEAIKKANEILKSENIYNLIKDFPQFEMSNISNEQVSIYLRRAFIEHEMYVYTYYKKWSRAYGYFEPWKWDRININEAKLNRSKGSIVATVIHEFVHFCDGLQVDATFGHGSNSPTGKQNTAPYAIDNMAQSLVDKILTNNSESSRIINTYTPWYKRVWRWLF